METESSTPPYPTLMETLAGILYFSFLGDPFVTRDQFDRLLAAPFVTSETGARYLTEIGLVVSKTENIAGTTALQALLDAFRP